MISDPSPGRIAATSDRDSPGRRRWGNIMTAYPTTDAAGRTVWACCVSAIGPVCGHRSVPVTDGWVTTDPGTSFFAVSPDAPAGWADGYRDSRGHHHRGRCFTAGTVAGIYDADPDDADALDYAADYVTGYAAGCRHAGCTG